MVPRPSFDPTPYNHPLISERAIDEPRPLRVIYIGAGISGIVAAIVFPKYAPTIDLAIYDKNADVGGTWFENRYPGVACDIPAHSYQLSFESDVDWSAFYAGGSEILRYWQKVARKYDVRRYMRFSCRCVGARWDEGERKWNVKFERVDEKGDVVEEFEDVGDVLITGTGVLNQWKWPDISGLKDFKGKLMHSASYDDSYDVTVSVHGRWNFVEVKGANGFC